jgi:hypothetical protein
MLLAPGENCALAVELSARLIKTAPNTVQDRRRISTLLSAAHGDPYRRAFSVRTYQRVRAADKHPTCSPLHACESRKVSTACQFGIGKITGDPVPSMATIWWLPTSRRSRIHTSPPRDRVDVNLAPAPATLSLLRRGPSRDDQGFVVDRVNVSVFE